MRILRTLLWLLVVTTCLTGFPHFTRATIQSTKPYQQMTLPERGTFVSEQARRLARQISGRDYQFTPAFEAEIQKAVEFYARRIGNNGGDQLGKGDAPFMFAPGQRRRPTWIGTFKIGEAWVREKV